MTASLHAISQPAGDAAPRMARVHAKLRKAEADIAQAAASYAELISTATEEAAAMSVFHGQGALEAMISGLGGLSVARREIGVAHLKLGEVRADYDGDGGEGDEFGYGNGKPKNQGHVG